MRIQPLCLQRTTVCHRRGTRFLCAVPTTVIHVLVVARIMSRPYTVRQGSCRKASDTIENLVLLSQDEQSFGASRQIR